MLTLFPKSQSGPDPLTMCEPLGQRILQYVVPLAELEDQSLGMAGHMDTAKDAAHTNRGVDFKSTGFQQSALHTAREAVLFGNFCQLQILSNKEGVAIPQEDAVVCNDEEVPVVPRVADPGPCGYVLLRCWIYIWNADSDPGVHIVLLVFENNEVLKLQRCLSTFYVTFLTKTVKVLTVFRIRIRIHLIHMFLGLPDPDPLVRGMDPDPAPDPDPSIVT
jgi:hypothetical protein